MQTDVDVLREAEAAFELQIEVARRLSQRKGADPYQAGLSSLSSGLRFASIFRDVGRSEPFFKNARRFLCAAANRNGDQNHGARFDPEEGYRRMRVCWGLYGVTGILGDTRDIGLLETAQRSVLPAFDGIELARLNERIAHSAEEVRSVSVVQMALLGLMVLAPMGNPQEAARYALNALKLPVSEAYEKTRSSLARLVMESGEKSYIEYLAEYRSLINLPSYRDGLVAGLTFVEVWLLATVKEEGDVRAGVENLFG
ncbi:MAG: hypothetical protein GY906_04240 [bacterium]|nr:hypothetical protein [bacterium]